MKNLFYAVLAVAVLLATYFVLNYYGGSLKEGMVHPPEQCCPWVQGATGCGDSTYATKQNCGIWGGTPGAIEHNLAGVTGAHDCSWNGTTGSCPTIEATTFGHWGYTGTGHAAPAPQMACNTIADLWSQGTSGAPAGCLPVTSATATADWRDTRAGCFSMATNRYDWCKGVGAYPVDGGTRSEAGCGATGPIGGGTSGLCRWHGATGSSS